MESMKTNTCITSTSLFVFTHHFCLHSFPGRLHSWNRKKTVCSTIYKGLIAWVYTTKGHYQCTKSMLLTYKLSPFIYHKKGNGNIT